MADEKLEWRFKRMKVPPDYYASWLDGLFYEFH
jgi:hypothetical protein